MAAVWLTQILPSRVFMKDILRKVNLELCLAKGFRKMAVEKYNVGSVGRTPPAPLMGPGSRLGKRPRLKDR